LPNEIAMMTTNLPSGYHRDLQLLKENLFPAFISLNECLEIATFMLQNITVKEDILKDKMYDYLFSVEVVNELALNGMPFRDAYKVVGEQIETGTFKPQYDLKHTHEGSIGNLMNQEITAAMEQTLSHFGFEKVNKAIEDLVR
jgi:argininosuccinate lyase